MTAQPTRDQLRALADKATPGPWSYADYGDPNPEHWPVGLIETDDGEEAWTCDTALAMSEPDAAFIAAARTALPHLLDQLDAAEQRIRDLTQEARDERGAALDQMEQVRIRDARIKAVEDVLDQAEASINRHPAYTFSGQRMDPIVNGADIRRALDG